MIFDSDQTRKGIGIVEFLHLLQRNRVNILQILAREEQSKFELLKNTLFEYGVKSQNRALV